MGNPLTSKERRGLVAVAAAALLCIGSGFIFRNCSSRVGGKEKSGIEVIDESVVTSAGESIMVDSVSGNRKTKNVEKRKSKGTKKKTSKKKKAQKVYPVRDPLSEPCD